MRKKLQLLLVGLVLGLGLVVDATYRSATVLRMPLISYVMNADSGRYADAIISDTTADYIRAEDRNA